MGGEVRTRIQRIRSVAQTLLLQALVLVGLASLPAAPARADELRRMAPFIRPLLMGDAYVAVGDEDSTVFYNPAGIARLPQGTVTTLGAQFILDDLTKQALTDPDAISAKYQNLSPSQFRDLLGTRAFVDLGLPLLTYARPGYAWGIVTEGLTNVQVLGNPILPGLHLEVHGDAIGYMTLATKLGEDLAIGVTPKVVYRVGLDKVFTFGELFAGGSTLNLDNQPDFKNLKAGVFYTVPGVDVGAIWNLPFGRSWQPRVGVSALNIGGYDDKAGVTGMEFGKRPTPFDQPIGGELPQINTVGFAISPIYAGVRYTVALDFVDVTQSVLPGTSLELRTRLGTEVGLGVRDDGTALFSILGGWNAGHVSAGVLARVWIFQVGFGQYTVEEGQKPGDDPSTRTVFLFSFRF
ncbi:MAG TPA: hypothetical protein VL359_07550 [bacterium]|nr:hypothetical protein [bacterium]